MSIPDFFALTEAQVPNRYAADGETYLYPTDDLRHPTGTLQLRVIDLGELRVASGRLEVCDPYVNLGDSAVLRIPPGNYPARATVVDVSFEQDGSHLRAAYLSLILGQGEPVSIEPAFAEPTQSGARDTPAEVLVDAGTAAFVDHEAVASCMPPDEDNAWWEIFFGDDESSWESQLSRPDTEESIGGNLTLPLATAKENIVLCDAGWGDGAYGVFLTRDATGQPVGVHIDFEVVGSSVMQDNDDPTASDNDLPQSRWSARSILQRILRR